MAELKKRGTKCARCKCTLGQHVKRPDGSWWCQTCNKKCSD